jgi:hypothetical protein
MAASLLVEESASLETYEAPAVESYEEDDAWTFAPCGAD